MTSGHVDQKILGDALEFPTSSLIAKSRFLKGAMTERLASWDQHDTSKRGIPDEKLVRLYEEWGKGCFGVILSSCQNTAGQTPELTQIYSRKRHGYAY